MKPTLSPRLPLAAGLAALLTLGACQSSKAPERAEIVDQVTTTARVLAVNADLRLVTLQREDGHVFGVYAGDEVRNFDQIDAGDQLRVRYRARLAASMSSAGDSVNLVEGAVATAHAPLGAKPAAAADVAVRLRVKIKSIDLANDIVVFSLASGELVAHRIATDEGRAFVKGLELDDTVQLDYSEALALSIEKL